VREERCDLKFLCEQRSKGASRQIIIMITFTIAGFLTDFTGGVSQIRLDGVPANVGAALNELWQLHVGLRDRVVNEKGEVRPHVNIFLNNENIKHLQFLGSTLSEKDEVTILPAVSGG
jgi:sulfur-carrier protein